MIAIIAVLMITLPLPAIAGGARSRSAEPVRQQPQADGAGVPRLPQRPQHARYSGRPADDPTQNDSNAQSCWVSLLPNLEQQALFNAWNMQLTFNDPSVAAVYASSCIPAADATVAMTSLNVFNCPSEVRQQQFMNTSASGRNDLPHLPVLALSSYSVCAGVFGPVNSGSAETFGQYSTTDTKHLNNGFADYGFIRRMKSFPDGTAAAFCTGETAYNNDGSWYGARPRSGCGGVSPMFNAWTVTLRFSSNFRITKNPPNTLPGMGLSRAASAGQQRRSGASTRAG